MTISTIVCCIEAGRLESQTTLMLESLRQFGGPLADARVLAVQPRIGPKLHAKTVSVLDRLEVELIKEGKYQTGFRWFGYSNKIRAIEAAQALALTEQIVWLDSDILVVNDLSGLILANGVDVAVRPEPVMPSVSHQDRKELAYWRALAKLVGVDFERIPWIEQDGVARLAYFNSGVIVWRRASSFAEAYIAAFNSLMKSRLGQSTGSFFAADQVILAPVIISERLTWEPIAFEDHRMVFPALLESDVRTWAGSNLLHYSGSRSGALKPIFTDRLHAQLPLTGSWVAANDPKEITQRGLIRAYAHLLKTWRHVRWRLYESRIVKSMANDKSPIADPSYVPIK